MLSRAKQESLANAKVSARQQVCAWGPRSEKIYDKEDVGYNSVAIFIRLAVVASQIC